MKSADGSVWHTLFAMDDLYAHFVDNGLPCYGYRRWVSTGEQPASNNAEDINQTRKLAEGKGFGFTRRAYDDSPTQDFSQLRGVKVAPGAVLALTGFTAADKVDRIVVESATTGMGRLESATLATNGTLEIGEVPVSGSFDVPADLSGVANPAALAGWTVMVGGRVKSKWAARAMAVGIHVARPGTILLIR